MRSTFFMLLAICVLALVPRVLSVTWNTFPHADVIGDAAAAASFLSEGKLLVSHNTDVDFVPYFMPKGIGRNLLVQHPPILPLLGAATTYVLNLSPTDDHAFFALRVLSVLSGMAVIILSALVAGKIFSRKEALWIAVFLACSYLMIDYSGNGSFYSLQAALYLVWILVAYKRPLYFAVWLGVISGIGYLVNHQAMVLAASSALILIIDTDRSWKSRIIDLVTVTLVTLLVSSPWLIRNYFVYGDFFFSHAINSTYIYSKASIPTEVIDGRIYYVVGMQERIFLLKSALTSWLPNNLYYVARKLFILAPVLFFFFSFAWIDYLYSNKRVRTMLPILILFLAQLFISSAWPITKFRYFVPLFPLVLLISMDQIRSLHWSKRTVTGIFTLTTICMLVGSYLTYTSVPTHTYYYDGAITQDPFHGRGELDYVKELNHSNIP